MLSVVLTVLLHERTSNFAHLFEKSNSKTKRYGPRERVVVSCSERTTVRCVFCVVFVLLWRSRRSHDAKRSKKIEKYDFCVIPGAENAYFRPKPQTTRKLDELTVGLTPIDPRGFRPFVDLGGGTLKKFEKFAFFCTFFGRNGQTR